MTPIKLNDKIIKEVFEMRKNERLISQMEALEIIRRNVYLLQKMESDIVVTNASLSV